MKSLLWKAGIGLLSLTINGYAADINCTVGKLGNKWCEPLENGDYTSYIDFGENRGTVLGHLAKDIGGDYHDSVYAIADGVIVHSGENHKNYGGVNRTGGAIIIRHLTESGKAFRVLYGHLEAGSSMLKGGTLVTAGQKIGELNNYVCDSGSYCPHLHFGVADDGVDEGVLLRGYALENIDPNKSFKQIFDPLNGFFDDYDPRVFAGDAVTWYQDCVIEGSTLCPINPDTKYFLNACREEVCVSTLPESRIGLKQFARSLSSEINICGNTTNVKPSPITSPSPEPIDGEKVDLNVDFDIEERDGHEISASSDTYIPKTVEVGDDIRLILQTQVRNKDTKDFLRNKDSESIEGPIFYKIEGVADWTLYASPEFKISDLKKNDNPDKIEVIYHFRIIQEDTIF